jgi:glycosyltransferase involved in cell wall biosynthesis
MAEAIEAVLGDRDRARAMGSDGRRRVLERFTARRMAEQTLRAYGALMSNHNATLAARRPAA